MFLEEINSKMTPIWSRRYLRQECLSIAPFVTPSIALLDSFSPLELVDKLPEQSARPLGAKLPVAVAPITAIDISKYSKNDLQRIFKAILEA